MRRSVEASVEIEAPVETVYGYWQTFENLSRSMANVDALRPRHEAAGHWTLNDSCGATVEFDAPTVRDEENRVLGRKTARAPAGPSGQVRFKEVEPNLTRVEVTVSYTGARSEEGTADSVPYDPRLMLYRDLGDLRETLQERGTPEEGQNLTPAATARSELAAFIAGMIGSALIIGLVLVLASRALGKRVASASRAGGGIGHLAFANRQGSLRSRVDSR